MPFTIPITVFILAVTFAVAGIIVMVVFGTSIWFGLQESE